MITAFLLAGVLFAQAGTVSDAQTEPQGAVKPSSPGTWELLDRYSKPLGYARQSRPDGSVEVLDRYGRRIGEIKPGSRPASPGRSGGTSR